MIRLFLRTIIGVNSVVTAMAIASICLAVPAHANNCSVIFGGTYTAVSDGVWAKTRGSYHDEATVTATWTVTSTCADYIDCAGRVASDQGWSAPAKCISGLWTVHHEVPNWEPCPDGTAASGLQTFTFASVDDPTTFKGWDKTVGPSGACGVNKWQTVKMPFTLNKIE